MEKIIYVGFGECKVSSDPGSILAALGLGSCVAVIFYCPLERIGGMAHVVLPSCDSKPHTLPGKYADIGIPLLLKAMLGKGCAKSHLVVKLAGGAEILKYHNPSQKMEIGKKNLEACARALHGLSLEVKEEETGGDRGRTVKLYVGTGKVIVKTMDGIKEL